MNTDSDEIGIRSCIRYFLWTWRSGLFVLLKVAGVLVMAALMLGIPQWLAQFAACIPFPSAAWRTGFSILGWSVFYGILVPLAFYVGGSSVKMCKRVTVEDFPTAARRPDEPGAVPIKN
jgi:hypothetical protein